MSSILKQAIFIISFLTGSVIFAQKPYIWIHTDLTSATGYSVSSSEAKATTDANSDPDDHVALSIYLMQACKFNTVAIVLGSTTRTTKLNTATFFDETFRPAYRKDYACLKTEFDGYPHPDSLVVYQSSLTESTTSYLSFSSSPDDKYDSYSSLPGTVKLLVDELKKDRYSAEHPLYVLVWGPMTEIAMVTKHLIRNNDTDALNRLHVVSHWTTSFTNQQSNNNCYSGAEAVYFGVANCNQNCEACKFMHDEAKKADARFKFTDVGSVGQTGIVNGYNNYFDGVNGSKYKQFQKSGLGDLFVKSKFVYGKPDGSDCASYYTILGEYGVTLSSFNTNGVLTENHETSARDTYKSNGHKMLNELLNISNIASGDCSPDDSATYLKETGNEGLIRIFPNPVNEMVYIDNQEYPDARVMVYDLSGRPLLQGSLVLGMNRLDMGSLDPGMVLFCISASHQVYYRKIVIQNE